MKEVIVLGNWDSSGKRLELKTELP